MSFAHLHVHTEYSLLDGFSNIKKLMQRVKEMEMPAVAITDHGTMFGVIDFYKAANEAGVKPVIGLEAYMAPRGMRDRDPKLDRNSYHLLLLAENQTGYMNLLRIASAAQLDGFYYNPRIDRDFLAAHAEELICTTGCMSAEIPRALLEERPEEAVRRMDWYHEVFGPGRFYVELQQHNIKEITELNRNLVQLGARYSAKFVATNDVHYINPDDARLQDILLAIQTSALLSDPTRMRMTDDSYYLRTPQEMSRLFAEVPEALSNTLLIAERCNVDLSFKGYHLPDFPVPEGYTTETYLRHLCQEGGRKRYGARADDPDVQRRLEYELGIVHTMGFDAYFLIVADLCRFARDQHIWYNARGSAAGSIIAYVLHITLVDPLQHDLLFERFLNPGRISMPDIDLDFQDDLRYKMLEYCTEKYGTDKVAQIITFGTMGTKAALRDVGRVMDIPLGEVDRVAKLVPFVSGRTTTMQDALGQPDFKAVYDTEPHLRELIDVAEKMEGTVRNAGTHAAGVVISDKPILDYLPLHRPTSGSEETPIKTVTQFEMGVLASLGMLKVDILGLITLTVMQRACQLIEKRHGVKLHLDNIPLDHPKAFELLGNGHTAGVFQVEGSGMTRYLMQMRPDRLDHIIAMVALYRPGPMSFIPEYIDRMHGKSKVEYRHPAMAPIFDSTFGIPVYQEQLMRAAVELAGYTPSESDELRSAISKKKKEAIEKHRKKFVEGAVKQGMERSTAQGIFEDWEEFACYGFNKSHAADYGVIAVQTAYLKANYAAEYMAALLSASAGQTEKVALYAADARSLGVPVLPPNVNCSAWDFDIEELDGKPAIRFGLGAIKNLGHAATEQLLEERGANGQYKDLNDFARRVDLRALGKRGLECLIKVGALDEFGGRFALLAAQEQIGGVSANHFRAKESGQLSLFGASTGVEETLRLPAVGNPDKREMLNWERELIGLYVSDHPLTPHQPVLSKIVSHFSGQLGEAQNEEAVRVAGLVQTIRPYVTKAGKPMGFVTLEDIQGNIELVLFPKTWERMKGILAEDQIIVVDGKVDTSGTPPKVLVDIIRTDLEKVESEAASGQLAPPSKGSRDGKGNGSWKARPSGTDARAQTSVPTKPAPKPGVAGTAGPVPTLDRNAPTAVDWSDASLPPPPDNFPADWEAEWQPGFEHMAMANQAEHSIVKEPATEDQPAQKSPEGNQAASVEAPAAAAPLPTAAALEAAPKSIEIVAEAARRRLPSLYPAAATSKGEDERPPKQITVRLRSTGDKERDRRRIKTIYGTLISFHGKDRFSFHIFEDGRGVLMDFPGETTRVCPEMLERLQKVTGEESWSVDEITFL